MNRQYIFYLIGSVVILVGFLTISSHDIYAQQQRHTIKKGDTLYSIAQYYNTTTAQLLSLNNITDPTAIRVGKNLLISNAERDAQSSAIHTVSKGETYYSIARSYNITVNRLLSLNKKDSAQILKIGEQLQLSAENSDQEARGGAPAAQNQNVARVSARVAVTEDDNIWPHSGARTVIKGKFPAIVITADEGDIVRAVNSGRVVFVDSNARFGNVVFIQSANGYIYIYGGQEQATVQQGERVTTGSILGRTAAAKAGEESALVYFSVWYNNRFIDPHIAPRS